MAEEKTYKLYQSYVENVREFQMAEKEIRRLINRALKTGKTQTVLIQTKLYALLYSTFSESRFMKMILTPYGFEQSELNEILKQGNILEKWLKCLDVAFNKFFKQNKGSEIPNKKQDLSRLIKEYVIEPSVLRNKIAHGQFKIALNKKNTEINYEISEKIEKLDFVTIMKWFKINADLSDIIEELIESPSKAHYNNYYLRYQQLVAYLEKTKTWTTESKLKTKSMKLTVKYLKR